jgi:hypothetical protein
MGNLELFGALRAYKCRAHQDPGSQIQEEVVSKSEKVVNPALHAGRRIRLERARFCCADRRGKPKSSHT